ncbi:LysR family transcriptional regulator [Brevibacterium sediminis]|uniref:LysR family transcriptional regulator n=1 Tax=Brevibacterium sediminis TaxID=1857024 RepID=A0ABQ1LYW3_9MICO|nr:LysR substrate-binding domain-containing protein [Brevibacterium sediminis]GGC30871.1 LysR family transcriptional regulator [Brevibacterium sediminis]
MELQQLRYALAVAEERNFTRAATKTHVVQSALSHQIKALERELGVRLFARTSRRVELTTAGHAFVAGARATLDAADRTVTEAVAATGQMRGSLSVGAIPTVTRLDLTAVLGRFHRTYPQVSIGMSVGGSLDFIERIRTGSLDAAVLGLPEDVEPKGVASTVIAQERLVAVLGPGHRFAERRRLRLADLADEAFVDFPSDSPGRSQSDRAFAEAGLTRTVAFESMLVDMMLDLVGQGLCIALLAPAVVPDGRELATVPVTDGPKRAEYLAWSEFNPSPAASAFVESALASLGAEQG